MNQAFPQITTVIPTHKRPHLVSRAIRSVLAQTYPYFEVCVYDNASGDDTPEVVAELARQDRRVKYYCHAENIGPWRNFQIGVSNVGTPYFNLLSDDDFLLPGFFERAVAQMECHPSLTMFAGATVRIAPGFILAPMMEWPEKVYESPDALVEMARRGFPDWNAILFRRAVMDRIGALDVSLENAFDEEFICRYASAGKIAVKPSAFAVLTLHGDSQSTARWSPAFYGALRLAVHERLDRLQWLDDGSRAALVVLRERIGKEVFEKSLLAAIRGQPTKALEGADFLEARFACSEQAMIIRTLASDNLSSAVLRSSCNLALSLKRPFRYWINSFRYRQFTGLMNSVLESQ